MDRTRTKKMGENAEGKDSSKVLNDSPFDAFANGCFVCISCLCFFFRTVVPNNVARVQNKTGDSVTFKCYDENDNINLVPRMEATLAPGETHDFSSPATGERKFKVFVAKSGFAVGDYQIIEKGKLFQWNGTNLNESYF